MIADLKPYAEYNKSRLPGLRQAPPYMPGTWIKDGATRIGYAISFATTATSRNPRPPSIFTVLNAAATTPMENYSSDSIEQVRGYIETIKSQFEDAEEESPIEYYFSRVTFEAEPDPELRRQLQEIKTALQLPEEQVQLLTEAGGRILRQSPDYQRLLGVLGVRE